MTTEFVPVFADEIAGSPVQLVDARLLHAFMEIGKRFATWIVSPGLIAGSGLKPEGPQSPKRSLAASPGLTHHLADRPQDRVQRIPVTLQVDHRGKSRDRGAGCRATGASGFAAAEHRPNHVAEPARR